MSKLRCVREEKKMTVRFVANAIGITVEEYVHVEENPLSATPSVAEKLAWLFRIPASEIFLS